MRQPPLLSIIIINYNTPGLVYSSLQSIKKHINLDYEVIVVDNSLRAELRVNDEELKKVNLPAFHLLFSANKGFGSANIWKNFMVFEF